AIIETLPEVEAVPAPMFLAGPAPTPFPQTNSCQSQGTVATNPVPQPLSTSEAPIRYFDGAVDYQVTDLASTGFGTPWSQTRSWPNAAANLAGSTNGVGWVDGQMPHLAQVPGGIAVVENGLTALTFDLVFGVFVERYGDREALTFDGASGDLLLGDQAGNH